MSNRLFNISTTKVPASVAVPSADVPGAQQSPATPASPLSLVGVISAPQSAITFAGAPAAVTLVWKVLGAAEPSLASSKLLAVALSLFIGLLIYWASAPVEGTSRDRIAGFLFALVNSFAIAAAVLGISSMT